MPEQRYLGKFALFEPLVNTPPADDLALVIIIPAYIEPDLTGCVRRLQSLTLSQGSAEIIVVLNAAETAGHKIHEYHEQQFGELQDLQHAKIPVYPILRNELPIKKAGVGLARKIGMDEGLRRLHKVFNTDGVLLCLDADCTVSINYLEAVSDFFRENPEFEAASLHFEHPYQCVTDKIHRNAIIQYELHLRYYIEAQRMAGFPFAYHTIGSAMAVRGSGYALVGGMNTRKAGEDFYFLHKCIERGKFGEITYTTVYPSARISDRVPFGTGRAMWEQLENEKEWKTYPLESFLELRNFFSDIPELYAGLNILQLPSILGSACLRSFLKKEHAEEKIREILDHTASEESFVKRFYRWFNAFMLMKYLHYARDHGRKGVPVSDATIQLLDLLDIQYDQSPEGLLDTYRELQTKHDSGLTRRGLKYRIK